MRWFSALQEPDNPFGASPWRHEAVLWDTGPHALSTLIATLGPILLTAVGRGTRSASSQPRVRATSTIALTQFGPPADGLDATTGGAR